MMLPQPVRHFLQLFTVQKRSNVASSETLSLTILQQPPATPTQSLASTTTLPAVTTIYTLFRALTSCPSLHGGPVP